MRDRDDWINEHYDWTTDSFDEEIPEEYKLDDSDWDDDTPSDKWTERRMEDWTIELFISK
mgnify:CR=1 FL=1